MGSASYRVTYRPNAFVEHAFAASRGDRRGEPSLAELTAALDRLLSRGLLTCLTAADVEEEARRRAASTIPEVDDIGYEAGMVDFTPEGYAVHREVIRAIYGDDFLANEGGSTSISQKDGSTCTPRVRNTVARSWMRSRPTATPTPVRRAHVSSAGTAQP